MNKAGIALGSLRNKVILIFLCILIVPFLWFAYYTHVKAIEGISNANTSMSLSFLVQARKSFELYLSRLNDQLNDLIGNKQLQDLLERPPSGWEEEEAFTVNMLTLLNQQTASIDAFRVHLYPIEPERYTDYMNTIGEPHIVQDEEWFRRAQHTVGPFWRLSMPLRGRYAKPLLAYSKRFTGLYDQRPRGIIAADVSEDQLARYFSPSGNIEGQKLLLLDEDGSVLYDSAANEWTGREEMAVRFSGLTGGEPGQSRTLSIEGQKFLASSLKLDSRPWYLVSLSPLSELTGTIDEINRVMLWFLVGYLLCCVGVVIYFTVHFTQPVVRLVQLMRKAERGNFHHRSAWSERNDEVGWLYRGFISLTMQIETLIEEASRSEWKKKELEFQVLSHQINPHFLYNTLESIRWKAETHGRSDISEMVAALGNLLRLSLNQGKEVTTLRRELEQLKAYVQIEQARMGRTIRILYAVEPELQQLPFLRLLLQPLVENAIQHSIRDNFEQGKILITARREKDDLILDIIDNGKGIPAETLEKLNCDICEESPQSTGSKGVGLRNVNERLRLYFGDAYRLQIESDPGAGTRIALRHPVMKLDPLQDEARGEK
ncbi:sensor histidine kinase [Paenibacillus sp. NFR01]|uniref:cache domain-containing sensor histidine kinase n=1 Tax=Paenibacillus sp. NFR01 TaxID=1566279 RepID=UPI0008CA53DE|nr:sensor histidine kinase [Paenibacillus sp. NFR01]SEU19123.1 Histidine kinase-, DNA gyrase B-, and HSP90-like ATPase [Paenibacillus sp. NFR01]